MRRSTRGIEPSASAVSTVITFLASVAACSGVSPSSTNIFVTCATILLAKRLGAVILIEVVVAVRQAEAALIERADLSGRVLLVLLGAEVEEEADCEYLSSIVAQQRCQRLLVVPCGDGLERRLNRLRAKLVGQIHIHAGGKVVAVLLLQRSLRSVGRSLQFLVEQVVVALGQLVEPSPSRLVRRNRVVLLPVAAGVLIEVGAGIGRLVDRRKVEADRLFGH